MKRICDDTEFNNTLKKSKTDIKLYVNKRTLDEDSINIENCCNLKKIRMNVTESDGNIYTESPKKSISKLRLCSNTRH